MDCGRLRVGASQKPTAKKPRSIAARQRCPFGHVHEVGVIGKS